MKITIIIPTYNRADLLGHAIHSILRQKQGLDLDILLVDDGSTDDTAAIAAGLVAHHSEIRLVTRENGGVAKARNTGLENLLDETEIITFLDSDDLLAPNRFAADLKHLQEDSDLGLTYGRMLVVGAFDYDALAPAKDAKTIDLVGIHLSSALIRRRVFDRIGGFDQAFEQAEDTDFLFRVFETGTRFWQTETICHYYLRHEDNMTSDAAKARSCFARAVFKSIQRRKRDPNRRLVMPDFKMVQLNDAGAEA